jgi:hypothetical protein
MFLRADDDLDEVIAIVREHESAFVRFEAINAYLWNHDDSEDAAENLRRALAEEFHKYIEMPRFAKGIDAYEFDRHVEEWQARWGGK